MQQPVPRDSTERSDGFLGADRSGFKKSSFSTATCTCVEVKFDTAAGSAYVRDNKYRGDPLAEPIAVIPLEVWRVFLDEVAGTRLAGDNGFVLVEDHPEGGVILTAGEVVLSFRRDEWVAFVSGVDAGEFFPWPVPV